MDLLGVYMYANDRCVTTIARFKKKKKSDILHAFEY